MRDCKQENEANGQENSPVPPRTEKEVRFPFNENWGLNLRKFPVTNATNFPEFPDNARRAPL